MDYKDPKQNYIEYSNLSNAAQNFSQNNFMNIMPKDQLRIIFPPNMNNNVMNNQNKNTLTESNMTEINQDGKKKKIIPSQTEDYKKNLPHQGYNSNYNINYPNQNGNLIYPNFINEMPMENQVHNHLAGGYAPKDKNNEDDNCNICKVLKFDSISTKTANIKLDLADDYSASFVWENKINNYSSYIKLIINDKILFYNYLNGKFIKHFVCNNFVYVYYDTNNLIHISSLLNTNVKENNIYFLDFE